MSNQLERFGLQWNAPKEFICTSMPDGYWTPWHIAAEALQTESARLEATERGLQSLAETASVASRDFSKAMDQISLLREGLQKYGRHLWDCPCADSQINSDSCECGLTNLRDRIAGTFKGET